MVLKSCQMLPWVILSKSNPSFLHDYSTWSVSTLHIISVAKLWSIASSLLVVVNVFWPLTYVDSPITVPCRAPWTILCWLTSRTPKMHNILSIILTIDINATDLGSLEAVAQRKLPSVETSTGRQRLSSYVPYSYHCLLPSTLPSKIPPFKVSLEPSFEHTVLSSPPLLQEGIKPPSIHQTLQKSNFLFHSTILLWEFLDYILSSRNAVLLLVSPLFSLFLLQHIIH